MFYVTSTDETLGFERRYLKGNCILDKPERLCYNSSRERMVAQDERNRF